MPDFIEKRRYPRVFFPASQKVEAEIVHIDSGWSVAVTMLDISEGGVGLRLKRSENISLTEGERICLKAVHGQPYLRTLSELMMEVRWVLDDEFFDFIAFGCQFLDLSEKDRELLQDFTLLMIATGKEEIRA